MEKTKSLIFFLGMVFLVGCHSFYRMDIDELREISVKDIVQIQFENGETINVTNVQEVNITKNKELEIIKYSSTTDKIDSVRTLYSLDAIKEIRVKKVDVQKTIFASIWITVGVALAIVIVWPGGFSMTQ